MKGKIVIIKEYMITLRLSTKVKTLKAMVLLHTIAFTGITKVLIYNIST